LGKKVDAVRTWYFVSMGSSVNQKLCVGVGSESEKPDIVAQHGLADAFIGGCARMIVAELH
jgi:hypothetical protein